MRIALCIVATLMGIMRAPLLAYGLPDTGDFGAWALLFVGVIIVACIVYAIMKALEAPPLAYKVAFVGALVLLLIGVIVFFFGAGGHSGLVR